MEEDKLDSLIKFAEEVWKDKKRRKSKSKLKREAQKFINEIGIEMYDIEGDSFDPGLAVEVIDYKNRKDSEETVIEKVLSPIILFDGEVVQRGQVIVAGPKKGD